MDDPSDLGAGEFVPFAHPEALTEPEKLLTAYFRSSTVGLSILNSAFSPPTMPLPAMNGLAPAEHLGKTVREVLGDFADTAEPKLRHTLATGEPLNFEISAKLPKYAGFELHDPNTGLLIRQAETSR